MVGVRVRVRVENMVGARVGTRVRIRIRARVTTHWPFWGFVPSLVRVRAMWLGTVLACSCCGASALLHAMHVCNMDKCTLLPKSQWHQDP